MRRGFTLIELLIVISIIAILAATIIPNFVGFDVEARVAATKTNLDAIRTRVTIFRAKEGRYPDSLGELLTTHYYDVGVKRLYLTKIPPELITDKQGENRFIDITGSEDLTNEGGWAYIKDSAEVVVNFGLALDTKWGEYEGQKPNQW